MVLVGLVSWLLPILSILIKADSRGPVFFTQKRIGKNGKPFNCHKLRTMIHQPGEDDIPALHNDPRITRFGHFLRRTNLDELPQFWNVLIGDMSVIGPRPHMNSDCIRFSFVISSYGSRHIVKPGITGLAQVNGFHGPAPDYDNIVQRFHWDATYVHHMGLSMDGQIIWKTFAMIVHNFLQKNPTKKL